MKKFVLIIIALIACIVMSACAEGNRVGDLIPNSEPEQESFFQKVFHFSVEPSAEEIHMRKGGEVEIQSEKVTLKLPDEEWVRGIVIPESASIEVVQGEQICITISGYGKHKLEFPEDTYFTPEGEYSSEGSLGNQRCQYLTLKLVNPNPPSDSRRTRK